MSVNISCKGTLHSYDVSPMMTVQDLIEEIQEKQKLPRIMLKLGAVELLPTSFVRKYLLTSLTLCNADVEVIVEINDLTLDVRMIKMPSLQLLEDKATCGMTIGQLKRKISVKFQSTQGNWVMKRDGKAVNDDRLLESLITKKTFTVIELMLLTVSDSTYAKSVLTHVDMTIAQFKAECGKKFPGSTILSISFDGEYLNDYSGDIENRVGTYGMKDMDTVIVVSEVHGGLSPS